MDAGGDLRDLEPQDWAPPAYPFPVMISQRGFAALEPLERTEVFDRSPGVVSWRGYREPARSGRLPVSTGSAEAGVKWPLLVSERMLLGASSSAG